MLVAHFLLEPREPLLRLLVEDGHLPDLADDARGLVLVEVGDVVVEADLGDGLVLRLALLEVVRVAVLERIVADRHQPPAHVPLDPAAGVLQERSQLLRLEEALRLRDDRGAAAGEERLELREDAAHLARNVELLDELGRVVVPERGEGDAGAHPLEAHEVEEPRQRRDVPEVRGVEEEADRDRVLGELPFQELVGVLVLPRRLRVLEPVHGQRMSRLQGRPEARVDPDEVHDDAKLRELRRHVVRRRLGALVADDRVVVHALGEVNHRRQVLHPVRRLVERQHPVAAELARPALHAAGVDEAGAAPFAHPPRGDARRRRAVGVAIRKRVDADGRKRAGRRLAEDGDDRLDPQRREAPGVPRVLGHADGAAEEDLRIAERREVEAAGLRQHDGLGRDLQLEVGEEVAVEVRDLVRPPAAHHVAAERLDLAAELVRGARGDGAVGDLVVEVAEVEELLHVLVAGERQHPAVGVADRRGRDVVLEVDACLLGHPAQRRDDGRAGGDALVAEEEEQSAAAARGPASERARRRHQRRGGKHNPHRMFQSHVVRIIPNPPRRVLV